MKKIVFALLPAAIAVGATMAYADGAATVEARQNYFKALGKETKALGGLTKAYDADAAKATAAELEKVLATDTAPLFAPGTSDADFPGKTRAKASIWENMEGTA